MSRPWKLRYAARFIAPWEGLRLVAYQDSGGVWTIGYGHTNGVYPGQTCSRAQAMAWLVADIRDAARAVARYVRRRMSIRQRIMAISWAFNCGSGALAEATWVERFNAGDVAGAAEALQWWVKDAAGNELLGLKRRRKAEAWLLTHPWAPRRNPHRDHPVAPQGKAHR